MRASVIIAAYNAEAYVAEAVESVLGQSRPPDEVIVVDDGSTDRTPAILAGFGDRIVHLSQANLGQAAAVNRALGLATGDVLGFCDADDLWTPRKLEWQLERLGSCDAVFGKLRQFVSPELPEPERQRMQPAIEVHRGELKICMLVRRSTFDRIGPFDEVLPATFFTEWLGRAKGLGLRIDHLDEIVALRRLHRGNGGRTNTAAQDIETLLALRKAIKTRPPRP